MTKFLMIEEQDAVAITRLAKVIEEVGKNKVRLDPMTAGNLKATIREILRVLYANDLGVVQEHIVEGETFRIVRTNQHGRKTRFRIKIVQER